MPTKSVDSTRDSYGFSRQKTGECLPIVFILALLLLLVLIMGFAGSTTTTSQKLSTTPDSFQIGSGRSESVSACLREALSFTEEAESRQ